MFEKEIRKDRDCTAGKETQKNKRGNEAFGVIAYVKKKVQTKGDPKPIVSKALKGLKKLGYEWVRFPFAARRF